jgi:flagellar basal-body rod protein FlgG
VARIGGGNIQQTRNIGHGMFFTTNISDYTDFSQGSIEGTGRELDMAISGDGFFLIRTEDMGDVMTRNGQFDVDEEMNLVLPGAGQVLDDGGSPITLESSSIRVDAEGNVYTAAADGTDETGDAIARIGVYDVEDLAALRNAGKGFYQSEEDPDAADAASYRLIQNTIEKANVNMALEMSRVMAGQNMYNACSQVVKMYDQLNETLVTQIGRIN